MLPVCTQRRMSNHGVSGEHEQSRVAAIFEDECNMLQLVIFTRKHLSELPHVNFAETEVVCISS